MSEYSVYFNPPGFDDYPRTVQDTVDHVALNAHVERTDVADVYVTGSTIPSVEDNNKIWIHYPNSTVSPPEPGVDPNLPTPQPLSYFPGSTKSIDTLASVPAAWSVFLDESTQDTWAGTGVIVSPTNNIIAKINSNLQVTNYNMGAYSYFSITKTPGGKLFAIGFKGGEGPILYELVGSSFVLRTQWNSATRPSAGYPPYFAYPPYGLISDSSGNLYFAQNQNIFKITVSSGYSFSVLSNISLGANDRIEGLRFNSSGNIVFIHTTRLTNAARYVSVVTPGGGPATQIAGPLTFAANQPGQGGNMGIDSSDNLYVGRGNALGYNNIFKITPGGTVSEEAGTGSTGYVDGAYLSSEFDRAAGVFVSSTGNLYIADLGNGKIRATSGSTNTFSTVQNPDFIAANLSVPFSFNLTATNSPTSYNANSLPTGLTINTSTGLVSGTPSAVGVFSSTMQAENAFGGSIKGTVFNVQQYIPTDYFNTPALRRFAGSAWYGFENVQRGDIILAPEENTVLFPWGESGKAYNLSQFGQPIFQVPTLPTPPAGFVYKYYIGAQISQPTPPVITP